jgi:hypothetical protein
MVSATSFKKLTVSKFKESSPNTAAIGKIKIGFIGPEISSACCFKQSARTIGCIAMVFPVLTPIKYFLVHRYETYEINSHTAKLTVWRLYTLLFMGLFLLKIE